MSTSSRRVLITGASSGLGREMAVQLARQGCRLALTARREGKLNQTAEAASAAARAAGHQPQIMTLLGSVSDLDVVRGHYAQIREAWGGVDWAILNAGVGDRTHGTTFNVEHYRWTFETNLFGVANWMEVLIPDMLAARAGVIAGISSLAAFRGLPTSGGYSASKAALVTMLESVRVDLRGSGVDIVTICPGFIETEITARNAPGSMPFLMKIEPGVRAILKAVRKRKRLVAFPLPLAFVMRNIIHTMPCWLYDRVASGINRDKKPYVDESKGEPAHTSTDAEKATR